VIPSFVPSERTEDFAVHVDTVGERADHLRPIFEDIVDKMMARERRLFETRGASGGTYWSPLKPSTIAGKGGGTFHHRRAGRASIPYPDRPLWRYGDLVDSLSRRGHRDQILDFHDDGFEFGTKHEAAGFHDSGTSKMPRRPPLVIPANQAREYNKMIFDFIMGT
jgi:hypothetical protein